MHGILIIFNTLSAFLIGLGAHRNWVELHSYQEVPGFSDSRWMAMGLFIFCLILVCFLTVITRPRAGR